MPMCYPVIQTIALTTRERLRMVTPSRPANDGKSVMVFSIIAVISWHLHTGFGTFEPHNSCIRDIQ